MDYASLEKESGELAGANSQLAAKGRRLEQEKEELVRAVRALNEKYEKYEGKQLITYS